MKERILKVDFEPYAQWCQNNGISMLHRWMFEVDKTRVTVVSHQEIKSGRFLSGGTSDAPYELVVINNGKFEQTFSNLTEKEVNRLLHSFERSKKK